MSALELHDHFDFHWHPEGEVLHADSRPCVAPALTEDFDKKVRCSVDDGRLPPEVGRATYEGREA